MIVSYYVVSESTFSAFRRRLTFPKCDFLIQFIVLERFSIDGRYTEIDLVL